LFAVEEHRQSLHVASLGVAKEYRRVGMGTYMLGYIEKIAEHMGKGLLEVDVLTKNIPAQRLYIKHGFTFTPGERTHGMMRGKKWL